MELNIDQVKARQFIHNWWLCNQYNLVLNAKAGTGKTFLVNYILDELEDCSPILLCPTHESLKQLRDKIDLKEEHTFRTIHAALGITPTRGKDLEFRQGSIPKLWEDFNLAVIDEASMVTEDMIETILSIGVKVLWLGHDSQLPPVEESRTPKDLCVSPVFDQGWETITLSIPQRSTGKLWDFNNIVEDNIGERVPKIPKDYDISKKNLIRYLNDSKVKESFLAGTTKVACWTNSCTDRVNGIIRYNLFGDSSKHNKYLPGDRVILTSPLYLISDLDFHQENSLLIQMGNEDIPKLHSNTQAIVKCCTRVTMRYKGYSIGLYKIEATSEGQPIILYQAIDPKVIKDIAYMYEKQAWSISDKTSKNKIYEQRKFFLSCFASVLHHYCATAHRLQGSTVPNVVVLYNDILRNPCVMERGMCMYVATSRAQHNLFLYRGAI